MLLVVIKKCLDWSGVYKRLKSYVECFINLCYLNQLFFKNFAYKSLKVDLIACHPRMLALFCNLWCVIVFVTDYSGKISKFQSVEISLLLMANTFIRSNGSVLFQWFCIVALKTPFKRVLTFHIWNINLTILGLRWCDLFILTGNQTFLINLDSFCSLFELFHLASSLIHLSLIIFFSFSPLNSHTLHTSMWTWNKVWGLCRLLRRASYHRIIEAEEVLVDKALILGSLARCKGVAYGVKGLIVVLFLLLKEVRILRIV